MKILLRLSRRANISVLLFSLILLAFAPAAICATRFEFADNSRLASGTWYKIGVRTSGAYCLTNEQIRKMGFSDPSKVKIYGYGGEQLHEQLSPEFVIDDLPQSPSEHTPQGVVFYARGPISWSQSRNNRAASHRINAFSDVAYYFVTENDEPRNTPVKDTSASTGTSSSVTTYFRDNLLHHLELESASPSGHAYFGESLKGNDGVTVAFNMPDIVAENTPNKVLMRVSAFHHTTLTPYFTKFQVTTDSEDFPAGTFSASQINSDSHVYGVMGSGEYISSSSFKSSQLNVKVSCDQAANIDRANLNFIEISYLRHLRLNGPSLSFTLQSPNAAIAGAGADLRVWDVSDPRSYTQLNVQADGDRARWYYPSGQKWKRYVAWQSAEGMPQPEIIGYAPNQNIHGLPTPDMVIFTLPQWYKEACDLAAYRKQKQGLDVMVTNLDEIYNEFSSGTPDIQAMRRMLKMFYERPEKKLKYALVMGRPTWDYRRKTKNSSSGECAYPAMPAWSDTLGLIEFNQSLHTDDMFGLLEDGATTMRQLGKSAMSIAVGRLPVINREMAAAAVKKIIDYERGLNTRSSWRGKVMYITDLSDNTIDFQEDAEAATKALPWTSPYDAGNPGVGNGLMATKAYIDFYKLENGKAVKAFDIVKSNLQEGTAWMIYIGHSSQTVWGGVGIMPTSYVQSMSLRRKPIVVSASCHYSQIDGPNLSGAEMMWRNPQGPISVIATTRSAAIYHNGEFVKYLSSNIGRTHPSGRAMTLGEVFQKTKNDFNNCYEAKVYILIGDPAMIQSVPANTVDLTMLKDVTDGNDKPIGSVQEPPYLEGGSHIRLEGTVATTSGQPLDDFNGEIEVTLYDSKTDMTTLGQDVSTTKTYEVQGPVLSKGRAAVRDGRWTMDMLVPIDIANNNRPGFISMYAVDTKGERDALGGFADFTISGFKPEISDDIPPVIDTMYLNRADFANGSTVDANPTLFAHAYDNLGINLGSGGVGHTMTLTIDGYKVLSDLTDYFLPDFASTSSGSLAYPLSGLSGGGHTATLTVFDNTGNSTSRTIEFWVDDTVAPTLIDVYALTNASSSETLFYVTHDRPDKDLDVEIEVFDLGGRRVWVADKHVYSDGNMTEPISWDMTTNAGSRVSAGIYVYRASISMPDGEKYSSESRKLAVRGRE